MNNDIKTRNAVLDKLGEPKSKPLEIQNIILIGIYSKFWFKHKVLKLQRKQIYAA